MIVTNNGIEFDVLGLSAVEDERTGSVFLVVEGSVQSVPVVDSGRVWDVPMTHCFLPVGSRRWVKHLVSTVFLADDCDELNWTKTSEHWRQRMRRLIFDIDGGISSRITEEPTITLEGVPSGYTGQSTTHAE